jgi:hypothetical protein
MAYTPSQVMTLANAGPRIEHLDASGGGFITRTFLVTPYTSYPYVETLLKGTVVQPDVNSPIWARVKPHSDPYKWWFYCTDVKVVPFANEAINGAPPAPFTPSNDFSVLPTPNANSQQAAINGVLNRVDDFNFSNIIDFGQAAPLTPAQIQAGGVFNFPFPGDPATLPGPVLAYNAGKTGPWCGAYLICTYTPLIFLDGIQSNPNLDGYQDPYDYVNPTWTPIQVHTQNGRQLFFYAPNIAAGGINIGLALQGGLLDTFTKPEVIWEFSITRLMVPFLPHNTLGILNEKLNNLATGLGNIPTPVRTVRFQAPEPPPLLRAPDGATFYNITYKYLFRKLLDAYFDVNDFEAGNGGFVYGWVDWNHHYGIPSARLWPNIGTGPSSYYPVAWNEGLFQFFGNNHPLYLADQDMSGLPIFAAPIPGAFNLFQTEFQVGFQTGQ